MAFTLRAGVIGLGKGLLRLCRFDPGPTIDELEFADRFSVFETPDMGRRAVDGLACLAVLPRRTDQGDDPISISQELVSKVAKHYPILMQLMEVLDHVFLAATLPGEFQAGHTVFQRPIFKII